MPFANSYWSADYRSGIKALTVQSQQSLRQLHELRDFVARYTTHLRSNSVSQERFADVIGGIGAPFETPTGSIGSRSVSGRVFSGTRVSQGSFSEKNYISNNSEAYESEDDNKTFSKLEYDNKRTPSHSRTSSTNKSPPITIATATETYRNDFLAESRCLEILAAALDRQVLEEINSFIRVYEPVVRAAIETFEQLYDEQNQLSVSVEKLRIDYNEARRKSELGKEAPKANTVVVQEASDDEAENSESSPSPQLIASGTYLSKLSPQKLSSLVEDMIESIPSSKRSFPLPGHSNTVISSESLCAWLTKNRPCALNPTMRELEHFGQELVDAKLLVGTFLGAKKFRSKGMWFEWSDLAHYVAGDSQPSTAPSADNKRWLDTTKRFNSLVVNMSTMLGGNIDQAESQVQQRYDETYIQLQRTRHRLIEEFNHKAQTLERFEKLRIELIYQSLTRMSEAVYNSSLASSKRLHELATTFISSINKPQNYQAEFELLESNNSTGIFFPSVVAGSDPHRTTYNYFQNIKHQFNLYKDIPLQIPVEGDLLSFASLPLFLYRTTSIIEEKDDGTAKDLWHAPLDHHSYWQLKEKILSLISQYDKPDMTLDANASDRSVMEPILLVLESLSLANVINFVKNWLMEISDSVIPFMVYDGLVSSYTHERNDTLRILLTIPRSNLSSLVHLLEHICCVFGLSQIPNYSFSDTVDRDLVAPNDEDKIKQVSSTLNDMSAIGAVPFVHIILRPSLSKASYGFKPPIDIYQRLLSDLLDVDLRVQLFESLVESEKKYRTKKENTRLGLKKNRNLTPPRDELRLPELKSPHPVAADNFTLRPFRTGTTPIPSPVSSPGREIVVKKIRESHH